MALGGGLLGAGCGTDEPNDNEAGSGGGVAGSGGEGIGGSAGNEAGSGGGGTGGTPAEPREFTGCTGREGELVAIADGGVLVCTDTVFQDAEENPVSVWLRACSAAGAADCRNPQTFCGLAINNDVPFCIGNPCGDFSYFRDANNGDFFEACNPFFGFVEGIGSDGSVVRAPEDQLTGTCLPIGRNDDGTASGTCVAGGQVAVGGECAGEDARDPSTLCVQGSACSNGGTCFEICDAAAEPSGEGAFAGCDVAGEACNPATSEPPSDFVIGFCIEPEEGGEG